MLLDRVFLRLGNADSDEQLESCLSRFLPPVILKLSSPHEQVLLGVDKHKHKFGVERHLIAEFELKVLYKGESNTYLLLPMRLT